MSHRHVVLSAKYRKAHPVTSALLAADAVTLSRKAAELIQVKLREKAGIRKAVAYAKRKGATVPEGVTLASFTQAAKRYDLHLFER